MKKELLKKGEKEAGKHTEELFQKIRVNYNF